MQECNNCGNMVSDVFARVSGDNNGEVHACPSCTTATAVKSGAAALPDFDRRVGDAQ